MGTKAGILVVLFVVLASLSGLIEAQDVTFGTLPALQVTTPKPGSNHVPGDFNGDGVSDLLWFNPTTSQLAYWLMQTDDATGTVSRLGYQIYNITPGYFVGATGDFNNDGLADLAFTSANHDLYFWTNDGKGGFSAAYLGTYPSGWQLIGAGDVNGDGYDDLLWVNPTSCQFAYWLMKGTQRIGYDVITYTCGYYPLSIGYYTASNRISVVWTSANFDLYVWDSQGAWFASSLLGTNYNTNTLTTLIAFGGGYAGSEMTYVTGQTSTNYIGGSLFTRQFGPDGVQSGTTSSNEWDGGYFPPIMSAGYLIEGNGVNATGVIFQEAGTNIINAYGSPIIEVCSPVDGAKTQHPNPPAPLIGTCPRFTYPSGWYLIGAMANESAPLVAH